MERDISVILKNMVEIHQGSYTSFPVMYEEFYQSRSALLDLTSWGRGFRRHEWIALGRGRRGSRGVVKARSSSFTQYQLLYKCAFFVQYINQRPSFWKAVAKNHFRPCSYAAASRPDVFDFLPGYPVTFLHSKILCIQIVMIQDSRWIWVVIDVILDLFSELGNFSPSSAIWQVWTFEWESDGAYEQTWRWLM